MSDFIPPPPPPPPPAAAQPAHQPAVVVNQQQWEAVRNAKSQMVQPKKYSMQWWFLYFWTDAVARAGAKEALVGSQVASAKAKDKFRTGAMTAQNTLISIYNNDLTGATPQAKLTSVEHLKPAKLLEILTTLLRIGCRGVPLVTSGLGNDASADNILSCCSYEKGVVDVQVGWRSEARDWKMIKEQQGTKRQVEVKTQCQKMNMDQPWHPYSQSNIKNHLWFRAGAEKDNCFYSVISVGLTLEAVVSFPQMDANNYPDLPRTPSGQIKAVRSWTVRERTGHTDSIATVDTTTEPNREFLGTTVHAYLFLMKGLVLNVDQAARYYCDDAFPEKGVQHIALDDIYACFPIVRVHHEIQDQDGVWVCRKDIGHTVFIQEAEYAFPNANRECRYSDAARQALDTQLDRVRNQLSHSPFPAFSCGWKSTGTGTKDAEPLTDGLGRQTQITKLIRFERYGELFDPV